MWSFISKTRALKSNRNQAGYFKKHNKISILCNFLCFFLIMIPPMLLSHSALAETISFEERNSWNEVKRFLDRQVFTTNKTTLYCGCPYISKGNSSGSGTISYGNGLCEYDPTGFNKHVKRAERVEWEHIVPASLTAARDMQCWTTGLEPCDKPGRHCCEKHSPAAQAIIYDPYNLAPSIGQINAIRSDSFYAELPENVSDFNACPIEATRNAFEPRNCVKGDVARIWLYMDRIHGVNMSDEDKAMLAWWAEIDPVSEREIRIANAIKAKTGLINPFIDGILPSEHGACS